MVGDRHTMRVAGQIVEHVIRPAERPLGVDDPVFAKQRSQERVKGRAFREWFEVSSEDQLAGPEQPLQTCDELATKYAAQHSDRQEEAKLRVDPAGVIQRETACWNDAVNVRVMQQPPTVP